jgi:hypothetical protein
MSTGSPTKTAGKRVWSASDAESSVDSASSESSATESDGEDSAGEHVEPTSHRSSTKTVRTTPKPRFVTLGADSTSRYSKVEHAGRTVSAVVFPMAESSEYTIVSYTTELSPRRQTLHRARAVTVQGPHGGLVHHVVESILQEQKAIEVFFATKQVTAADINGRVLTKNSARYSISADKRGLWNIPQSKTRDSYKALMTLGYGPEPVLVFATFFAKHIISISCGDEPPAGKRHRPAAPETAPVPAPATLEPAMCQNLLWGEELEALIARAPAGTEKKFVKAFLKMMN